LFPNKVGLGLVKAPVKTRYKCFDTQENSVPRNKISKTHNKVQKTNNKVSSIFRPAKIFETQKIFFFVDLYTKCIELNSKSWSGFFFTQSPPPLFFPI